MERDTWTEEDFEHMNWHDSKIYAISFGLQENEVSFDIDYILKWVEPATGEANFKFFVAPATLVFRNVYDIGFDFYAIADIKIDGLYRDNPATPQNAEYSNSKYEYDWVIETTCGSITFKSVGFKQFLRQQSVLLNSQTIGIAERGGIGFSHR